MKVQILLSLFVLVTSANAQDSTNVQAKRTTLLEQKKRNEISINTAPLLRVLIGSGASEATRFSVTYKRNLTCKSAVRFSVMADLINQNSYNPNPWNEKIIQKKYILLKKQTTVSPSYVSPHVNIGYERLFGKHKLKWFYGTDLSIGYFKNESYIQNKTLVRDTAFGQNAWVEVMHIQADIVSRSKTKGYSIGLSPFFGAKFPISKRFSVSAQVGADMTFQNRDIAETKSGITKNYRLSTFDFNLNTGIINDISLIYKF